MDVWSFFEFGTFEFGISEFALGFATLLLCYFSAGAVAGSQLCCAVGSAPGPEAPKCVSDSREPPGLYFFFLDVDLASYLQLYTLLL